MANRLSAQEKEADVGVMLAFRSTRIGEAGQPITILNLSSWFIDPQFRWSGPLMMKQIIRDKGTVTTDLTSAPDLWPLLESFSFEPWNKGLCISAVPQSIRLWRRGAQSLHARVTECGAPLGRRSVVLRHLANIGFYLLRFRFLFVGVDYFESDRPKSGIFLEDRKFFKGAWNPESIDYAYSELVYFGL